MPQKPVASQAVSSQIPQSREAASEPEPAAPPDVPARAEVRQFNDNEAVLVELRRISAWADVQRKITRGSLIFAAVFIPALIVFGILLERQVSSTNVESTTPPEKPGWYDMDRNVRSGEFDKAIAIGEELLLKTPQYPEAHKRLAGAYLAAGNLEKAREHYAEAFRLFPSEENEKLLLALDKRSTTEKP
jgi:tetratricopeptide (TPR) repeat protein